MKILYEYEGEDEDFKNHIAILQMSTQIESLKSVEAKIDIFIDDSISKLSANIDLPSCNMTTSGQVEVCRSLLLISSNLLYNVNNDHININHYHLI